MGHTGDWTRITKMAEEMLIESDGAKRKTRKALALGLLQLKEEFEQLKDKVQNGPHNLFLPEQKYGETTEEYVKRLKIRKATHP